MIRRKIKKLNESPSKEMYRYEPNAYPRKSFYGKAKVVEYLIESDDRKDGFYRLELLRSYDTWVMAKLTSLKDNQYIYVANYRYSSPSNTTIRHIYSFSKMYTAAYRKLPVSKELANLGYGTPSNYELQRLLDEMLQIAKDEGMDISYGV